MTFSVEAKGMVFMVIYSVHVGNTAPEYGPCPDYGVKELPNSTKGGKGSSLNILELPTDGSVDAEALAELHSMFSFSSEFGFLGDSGLFALANLSGTAVGQTTGSVITVDDNAAGHGWYIDYTPYLNEEYLPTSNPNEWIARPGSEAEGKMDLLSVLLHEYGHVRGLDHSANGHDFMAATLAPGVRRLPSAEELAQLDALAVAATDPANPAPQTPPGLPLGASLGALLVGRLRRSDAGGSSVLEQAPQYEIAANPQLENPTFESGGAGWELR